MSDYLDLDATQAASLARGERVERWVRMEPQPGRIEYGPGGEPWDPTTGDILPDPPYPPGTRARVREPCWIEREPHEAVGCLRAFFPTDGYCHFEDGRPGGHSPFSGGPEWTVERREDYYQSNGSLHRVDAEMVPDWAIRLEAVCKSVTPEVRDGAWGFVEGWEVVRG